MQKGIRDFQIPTKTEVDKETLTATYGRFTAEPFERGFGTTVGNSLRRVLLSSLTGAAIVSVKIEGVLHEFSTIPGVTEDVTDIILNVKKIRLKLHADKTKTIHLRKKGPGIAKAGDIEHDADIEILTPDLHLATLDKGAHLDMEATISRPAVAESITESNKNLLRSVNELELSVRAANCLKNANIKTIADLVQKTEADMLRTKNFGKKSLNEIKEILSEMGLGLGMKLDHLS